jgi:hypothetical protein
MPISGLFTTSQLTTQLSQSLLIIINSYDINYCCCITHVGGTTGSHHHSCTMLRCMFVVIVTLYREVVDVHVQCQCHCHLC